MGYDHLSGDIFATHIPILIGLASRYRIRRVLEYGSGAYSTALFLNRSAFPHLEELMTFENDPDWAKSVREDFSWDNRFTIKYPPLYDEVYLKDPGLDLIFIDNSHKEDRVATIHRAATLVKGHLVVVHDAEVKEYQDEFRGFDNCDIFTTFLPNTAVAINGVFRWRLAPIGQIIEQNASRYIPEEINAWVRAFAEVPKI